MKPYHAMIRSGGMKLPVPVHSLKMDQCDKVLNARAITLLNAYLDHPERFVKGVPAVEQVPKEVWINKPTIKESVEQGVSLKKTKNVSFLLTGSVAICGEGL
jgi:hypothetical protein